VASCGVALVVVLGWLFSWFEVPAWGWTALGFLGLWNVQFACIAMLGEYIVRTHRHVQRRPLYVLDTLIENGVATPTATPDFGGRP